MKHPLKLCRLPILTLLLSVVCFALRAGLYAAALDAGNLLTPHPLAYLLWAAVLACAAMILVTVWQLDGSCRYEDNFAPSAAAAFGCFLMAAGIALTVLTREPGMAGVLGMLWKVTGLASVILMLWAGVCRLGQKPPIFLTSAGVCLFLLIHIMNQYQRWCSNPQLMDYVFALFGALALAFFAYYTAAFEAGCGNRRMQLGSGLLAVLFSAASLPAGEFPFLYLGGIAFALTNLCFLLPRPKEEETAYDPS